MKRLFFLFLIGLFGFEISLANDKPQKLARLIFFDGDIVDKCPVGHGTLILDRKMMDNSNYHIDGDFEGNNITNAKFYISNHEDKGYVVGNFHYTINKNESSITLEAYDVAIKGMEKDFCNDYSEEINNSNHINLGKFTIGVVGNQFGAYSKISDYYGMGFVRLYNIPFEIQGHDSSFPSCVKKLTGFSSSLAPVNFVLSVDNYLRSGFFELKKIRGKSYKKTYIFPNGDIYKCHKITPDAFHSHDGDVIFFTKIANGDTIVAPDSKIIMKDKSIMTLGRWRIISDHLSYLYKGEKQDAEVIASITFSNRTSFVGTCRIKELEPCDKDESEINLIKKIKSLSLSDIEFYEGTYTDSTGSITKYVEGLTESQYNQKKIDEENALKKAEIEKKKEEAKSEREWEHYKKTHPLKRRKCPSCHGTGRCHFCNGTRYYIDPLNYGNSGPCPFCLYKGICTTCDGDGIQEYRE